MDVLGPWISLHPGGFCFIFSLSLASIISILILLVSLSRLICVSYGMIDYNQNLTKNRDWRSMLITLAFYPTRLYQVLMLSFFDCKNGEKSAFG